MSVGAISGPISAGRTGVVVKIVDKQAPSADEMAKNFDQTREQFSMSGATRLSASS